MDFGIKRNRNSFQPRLIPLEDSLRELQELGCPVDFSVALVEPAPRYLEIQQRAGVHDCKVFNLEDGRFGFMFYVQLYFHKSRPMQISDIDMRWPWKNRGDLFHWLTRRTVTVKNRKTSESTSYEEYRFPGKNGQDFEAGDVLNELLVERKILPAQTPVSGWLLGIGGMMPKQLSNGGWIDARLVITTWDQGEFCETIHLWTERIESKRPSAPRRTDLFEKRIDGRTGANTVQPRPSKPAASKRGGSQQQAGS